LGVKRNYNRPLRGARQPRHAGEISEARLGPFRDRSASRSGFANTGGMGRLSFDAEGLPGIPLIENPLMLARKI